MTKAMTTSRPALRVPQLRTDPSTFGAKAKRPRGKAATASEAGAAPAAKSTPIMHAIPAASSKPPRQTKAALLRARLAEPGGVSLAALIEATGWQAHTLRAYLSGLRKEGLTLTRRREGEDTIYAIEQGGTEASGAVEDSTPSVLPETAARSTGDTASGEVPAVQGSGDGVDDADTAPATIERNA